MNMSRKGADCPSLGVTHMYNAFNVINFNDTGCSRGCGDFVESVSLPTAVL